jgi:hypothetical protein
MRLPTPFIGFQLAFQALADGMHGLSEGHRRRSERLSWTSDTSAMHFRTA